jgi:outer membrane protein TolC
VRQAERAAAADTARIGVAIASFFPQVSLGGTITAGAGHTDNLFNHSSISYAAGPLISWSFPNLIGQGARVAEAKATARASLARFDGVVLTALKETEQALALYAGELQRHDALAAARADYARALDLAKTRYAQGSASFLDVLDAERSLIAADTDLASSDARMSDDQVTLFKALGGGWRAQAD